MSQRTTLRPQTVIPSAQAIPANTGSMAASITGAPTILQSLSEVSYSIAWTGTSPVGTFSVEASNDCTVETTGGISGGTWNKVPLQLTDGSITTGIPVSGNTGKGFVDVETGAYALRPVYTATSGTGTITVTVNGKVK